MPYKNREDRLRHQKEYYHRHEKEWRKRSPVWNNYQKNYKLEKRRKEVDDIRKMLIEIDFGKPEDLEFKALVTFLYVIKFNKKQRWSIAYRVGCTLDEVNMFFSNWEKNGIYKDGVFYADLENNDGFETIVELSLISLCATGKVASYKC
jgi:hypothetical protein